MVPCLIREDTVVDEVDGQVRTLLLGDLPLDRRGRVPARVRGPPDARDGPARRQTRVGDAPPRQRRRATSCPRAASSATTGRPWCPSRTSTSTRRRCGRSTRPAASRSRARTSSSTRCRPRSARRYMAKYKAAARPAARRGRAPAKSMADTHNVRFEPVGIEIEVDEDETVLNAAFRQGLMLMHGCKEGQCSACKSFLLDGEVDLDRYSTFALPDFEEAEGYTLLCRAHADHRPRGRAPQLRRGDPAQRPRAADARRRAVEAIEALTHDIRRLVLALPSRGGWSSIRASTSTSRSRARTGSTARSRSRTCRPTRAGWSS